MISKANVVTVNCCSRKQSCLDLTWGQASCPNGYWARPKALRDF